MVNAVNYNADVVAFGLDGALCMSRFLNAIVVQRRWWSVPPDGGG